MALDRPGRNRALLSRRSAGWRRPASADVLRLWHAGSLRAPRLGCQRHSILTLPAAPHYRRCTSDGSNYLDPNRPDGAKAIRTLSPVLKRSAAGRAGVPWSAVFARFEIAPDQVNLLFRHEDQVRHLRVRAPRERQERSNSGSAELRICRLGNPVKRSALNVPI